MSDDYTFGQPFSSGPQFGMQGSVAEIESILERVKGERLRLIRLLKDCETRFGTTGVVPPAEEIARLTGKVRAIDEAVRNRYTQLRHDESLVERRANQIDQLHECVKGLADQVDGQITKAKSIEPDLATARQSVQNQADQVLQQARGQVAQIGQSMADRIEEYRHAQSAGQEQLRESRREIEQVFKDIDDRLAAAAGLARDEAQKLIDPIFVQLENHATECGQRIQQLVISTDDIVVERLEALPGKAHQALQPARETLDNVIEDARHQVAAVNDTLRSLDDRVQELSGKTEGLIQQQLDVMAERAGQTLDAMIAERLADQREAMDRQQSAFQERLQQQEAAFDQRESELTEKLQGLMMDKQAELIVTIDEQTQTLAERLAVKHQERIEQMVSERIDTTMSEADGRADAVAQQIKDRLAASLDQSRAEAEEAVGAIEEKTREDKDRIVASLDQHKSSVLESLDQIKEQAKAVSEKAERQASQVGDTIERTLREQVVGAMSRAEAVTDPFKARLEESLAEHRRLADDYSRTAETELTEKAKAHWDAFRHATQAALDKQKQDLDIQAQATIDQTQEKMRQRVQDLCVSCQSMVELIEQQLTRRLKGIEPQTHQAVEAVEKQIGERLSRMRENAESMVQLVEDQLGKRVSDLQPNAINAARDAERELNEHLDRVRQEVENVVAPLRRQVIEELGQIADVGKSVRGVIRHDASSPATQAVGTEPPVVDVRKLTTPLQEMASRMGKKAAKLVGSNQEATPPDNAETDPDRKAA